MQSIREVALSKLKENKLLVKKVKKLKPAKIDSFFHEAHHEAFACVNCLECANCCKTTGPLFTQKDIERIAKHLRIKPKSFISSYLRVDEEDDYVLQSVPCAFLGQDNFCSIYEVRPKACREYPHTDRTKQKQLLSLSLKNTEVCPAVQRVFEKVKQRMK